MGFIVIAIIVGYFFAMNIGASGAAASMGVAYGSDALKKKTALVVCGIGIFLGAAIGGAEVVKTIGSGIIPQKFITVEVSIIILAAATLTLFIANLIGIPLSTSEVTVGSVVGVGIAYQALYVKSIITILSFWIIVPIIAFVMAFIGGKLIQKVQRTKPHLNQGKWKKFFTIVLIIAGFFEAFSAGMNNTANAIGPLVGAGLISVSVGTLTGGLFIALGAILFGSRVLETNGKHITRLSTLEGITISGTAALLVIIASIFGIPVPLTQITTTAIVGIGTAQNGFALWQKGIISRIAKVWIVSPVFSLVMSYGFIKIFMFNDLYTAIVIIGVIIATVGTISLAKSIQLENQSVHNNGGGI